MDRAELRRKEREDKKEKEQWMAKDRVNMAWYKGLPVSRKMFIGRFVEQEAIKNDNIVAMIMDKCILAAMDDNTDLSIILMKKIIKEYNDYILEYKEYLDKNGNGGMDMIENIKVREEVKGKMKKMIGEGVEKVKGMAILKKEYNLPAAELSELWIDCKVELDQDKKLKKVEKNIETEKALDKYINEKLELKNPSDAKIGTVVSSYYTNEGFKIEVEPVGLQVIDEVKVVKGKFGYYHKSKDGIRFSNGEKLINDNVTYKSKEDLASKSNENIEDMNSNINKLKDELSKAENKLQAYMDRVNEINQVFDI